MWLLSHLVNSDVELLGKRIASSRLLWTPNRGEGFVVSLVLDILPANFIKILALGQNLHEGHANCKHLLIKTLSKYFSG